MTDTERIEWLFLCGPMNGRRRMLSAFASDYNCAAVYNKTEWAVGPDGWRLPYQMMLTVRYKPYLYYPLGSSEHLHLMIEPIVFDGYFRHVQAALREALGD